MRRRRIVLSLVFLMAVTFSVVAQAAANSGQFDVKFRLSPKEVWKYGVTFSHRFDQSQVTDLEFRVVCSMSVTAVDANGNGIIRASFEPLRLIWRGKGPIEYDSGNPPWDFPDPLCEFVALGAQTIEMTVAPNGQLISAGWVGYGPKKLPQTILGLIVHEAVGEIINFGFLMGLKYPDSPVAIGLRWAEQDPQFAERETGTWQILDKENDQLRLQMKRAGGFAHQQMLSTWLVESAEQFSSSSASFFTEFVGNAMVSERDGWPSRVEWQMINSFKITGKKAGRTVPERELKAISTVSFERM